jgi:LPXTG-site transpeptidase (sortase) family protein
MAIVKRYISADDLDDLFHKTTRRRRLPSWQIVSAIFLIVVAVFLFVNWPAMSAQIAYWWRNDIQASKQTPIIPPITFASPLSTPGVTPLPRVTQSTTGSIDPNTLANNTIYIPKTNTKAPVIWDVSGGADLNTDMLNALQKGVVRYPKTALPNQVGNVFLTGHSSNYWWDKGRYKTVFALINRLVAGDLIYIKYQNTLYIYKVSNQKTVSPTETSVLAPTKTPVLSLMTCTPTGTSLFRRIVTANLISPTGGLVQQPTRPDLKVINAVR